MNFFSSAHHDFCQLCVIVLNNLFILLIFVLFSMDVLTLALDIFLGVTYLGVFVYLSKIFIKWKEPSIGIWSFGSLIAAIAIVLHFLADFKLIYNYEYLFKVSIFLSFMTYSMLSIAHLVARRKFYDLFIISVLSALNRVLFILTIYELQIIEVNNLMYITSGQIINYFDVVLIIILLINYLVLVRDSEIIYRSTIKSTKNSFLRSSAITHLISWQFYSVGILIIWVVSKFSPSSSVHHFVFELPMLFLLVPILTLGSRPFDWTREGFEPIKLLLVGNNGNIAYSWSVNNSSPLLLEGTTFSTIEDMIKNIIGEQLTSMKIEFAHYALYIKTESGFQSVLVTNGSHPSFDTLLTRIHKIMVNSINNPIEFGVTESIPGELKWILGQLLPEH